MDETSVPLSAKISAKKKRLRDEEAQLSLGSGREPCCEPGINFDNRSLLRAKARIENGRVIVPDTWRDDDEDD